MSARETLERAREPIESAVSRDTEMAREWVESNKLNKGHAVKDLRYLSACDTDCDGSNCNYPFVVKALTALLERVREDERYEAHRQAEARIDAALAVCGEGNFEGRVWATEVVKALKGGE